MILEPSPFEERWDPRDLLDDRTEPFFRWLLKRRLISQSLIRTALGRQFTIEDLFQTACLHIVRWPPKKMYSRASVLAVVLKSAATKLAKYRCNRHRAKFRMGSFAEDMGADHFVDPNCPEPFELTDEPWFDFAELIERELRVLDKTDLEIIRLRFFDDDLMKTEVADRFGVSKSRIAQRELRAFARLRTCIEQRMESTAKRRFVHRLTQAMAD